MTKNPPQVLDLSFLRDPTAQRRIALITLAFGLAGALYWLVAPKWYRSTLTIVPAGAQKSSGISALMGGELGGLAAGLGASIGSADVARIGAVLQSAAVSDAVVQKFDLQSRYGVSHPEGARDALWQHCDVKTLPKPSLVQVSCEDKDPRFAQSMLTFFADYGNQVFRRVSVSSATEEVRFLERRIAELRQQAEAAAGRVREFQEKHQIVELEAQARAVVSAMAVLNGQRIAKQMELGYARTFSSRDEASSRQLESQLSIVEETLRDLDVPESASHPPDGSKGGIRKGTGAFPAAAAVPRLRAEYESLYRDRKVAEATLVFSLDRLESAKATEARDVSTFQILDPATLPSLHSRPKGAESVAIAALLGLVVSTAFEWWRAQRSADERTAP
jgi:capsule polysaccharide export protein KpsE/RkpR